MAFDRKTTLAHRLLGRDGKSPLLRRTAGTGVDLFYRPNGFAVVIGNGCTYLMVGPRVNLEKAVLAFVGGVRTPPAGATALLSVRSITPEVKPTDIVFANAA